MCPLLSPSFAKVTIKPITSDADLLVCAHLADIAIKPDGFHEFIARYSPAGVYGETLEKLTESLHDERGRFCLLKAVVPASSRPKSDQSIVTESQPSGEADAETIVGFAQWRCGHVEVPKMDPFMPQRNPEESLSFEGGVTNVAIAEANGQNTPTAIEDVGSSRKPKPFYSNPKEEFSRKVMNAYISTIRGKRHVYLHRLIVDPNYQRQGIGQKLLDWGIETSDRENIVAWLFCRPAGYKLYERNGWKVVLSIDVDVPDDDLNVAPILAMLRLPAPRA